MSVFPGPILSPSILLASLDNSSKDTARERAGVKSFINFLPSPKVASQLSVAGYEKRQQVYVPPI